MKSFATAAIIAASAAIANAQYTYNSTTNVYTCPIANGSYCAGTSLGTNIIIRCTNGIGQPGNCNDNLAGEPPLGVLPADCYQTSDSSGDASCAKNCIVYASAVSSTFSLPSCTPTYTASSSAASTSSVEASTTASSTAVVTTTVVSTGSAPTSTVLSNSTIATTSGTSATNTPVGPSTTTSTSAPTTSSTVGFTGAAAANSVGSLIAAAGILAAYFL